jgi:hypothetical protein
MNEPIDSLTRLLTDVILPNLKAVHASQAEQIAANDRLELAVDKIAHPNKFAICSSRSPAYCQPGGVGCRARATESGTDAR